MAAKSICKVESCDKPAKSLGYCGAHHYRFKRYGDPEGGKYVQGRRRICCIDGCGKQVKAHDLCDKHYRRWSLHGEPLAGRTPPGALWEFLEAALQYDGDDCLHWPYTNVEGYGLIAVGGRKTRVNRIVCEFEHGPPPTPDHDAAHSCGNPPCCNRRHVRWATRTENMADCKVHGTVPYGPRNGCAKLTEADVRHIMSLRGVRSQGDLAQEFGVVQQTISLIQTGARWGHLGEDSAA